MILYNHEYDDALICDALYTINMHYSIRYCQVLVIQLSYANIITKQILHIQIVYLQVIYISKVLIACNNHLYYYYYYLSASCTKSALGPTAPCSTVQFIKKYIFIMSSPNNTN